MFCQRVLYSMQVGTNAKIVGLFVFSTLQCNFCHVFAPKTQTFLVRKERKKERFFFLVRIFSFLKRHETNRFFWGGGLRKNEAFVKKRNVDIPIVPSTVLYNGTCSLVQCMTDLMTQVMSGYGSSQQLYFTMWYSDRKSCSTNSPFSCQIGTVKSGL